MARDYSLSHLTTEGLRPPEMLEVAARTGYHHAGLRLLPAAPGGLAFPLMEEPALRRDTLAAMADTGVTIFDLEMIRLDARFQVDDYLAFFEVGAELGARVILVAADDPDPGRLVASYAALCEAARPFGLTCDLEFMPWTRVPDLATAQHIVAQAKQPNSGIIVDALHFDRSGGRPVQLAELPRDWLHYAQLCDGPAQRPVEEAELIHAARTERWLPGEGGIDLAGFWRELPADLPVSVEVPNQRRIAELGHERWAREALLASQRLIESLEP
ncbi:sugar phosphate isomerase/epimerase family protein [Halomonas urumqiensis]|uniref:Xylose isomerase n=1 Tax=Halomonas urumqiensis TaxID=1684789 RepID=A0A2N7UJ53_9GAMM|nr:TIM barrel protein [Halomonas urumqiensis]PMR80449.1 xylose isomerase [Halomonas urumqiensis]PTB01706.1 sugar phosphate isomerase/epimerase [Halomonas urumqiensis]GHE22201.1 xylose isomerase [Halomonas urumqiensis]